ncbi:MAG: bifunctional helix-turn-helix domain-containing protein/methylated-DNA--[protein]-cysteine S-methyltransferase [Pseudomonadota bacterium]
MNIQNAPNPHIEPSNDAYGERCKAYDTVQRAIAFISENAVDQPDINAIAKAVGEHPTILTRKFRVFAGLTPKAFLQAVTLDKARAFLDAGEPVLETSIEVGLSGPSRLHDLFVTHHAMPPGAYRAKGAGLDIRYGYHASPFGVVLLMVSEHGIVGLAFCDDMSREECLNDMASRWPAATYNQDQEATANHARQVFDPEQWRSDEPIRIALIGTDFQIRVWEALLKVPMGATTTYGAIAEEVCTIKASRAVGAAVGRNPISFVVPCHRAVGSTGALTGYHWGLTRKRAMLGWEAAAAGRVR